MLKGKRGFIHHPAFIGFIAGLIIGILLVILAIRGVIPVNLGICP